MRFEPAHAHVDEFSIVPTADLVEAEPMLFMASVDFAREHGGPLTRDFCSKLLNPDWIIDSRVSMLKPGWLPCIGGWHLDHLPRGGPNHQPSFARWAEVESFAGILDAGTGSLTEYLDEIVYLPQPESRVFETCDRELRVCTRAAKTYPSGSIVWFRGWHRGVPAVADGWRFWIRASRAPWRQTPVNKIRRQTNVYIADPNAGW